VLQTTTESKGHKGISAFSVSYNSLMMIFHADDEVDDDR
jgi:hypothetical protein